VAHQAGAVGCLVCVVRAGLQALQTSSDEFTRTLALGAVGALRTAAAETESMATSALVVGARDHRTVGTVGAARNTGGDAVHSDRVFSAGGAELIGRTVAIDTLRVASHAGRWVSDICAGCHTLRESSYTGQKRRLAGLAVRAEGPIAGGT